MLVVWERACVCLCVWRLLCVYGIGRPARAARSAHRPLNGSTYSQHDTMIYHPLSSSLTLSRVIPLSLISYALFFSLIHSSPSLIFFRPICNHGACRSLSQLLHGRASVHVHPVTVLPITGDHHRPPLRCPHRHVESRVHPCRAVHRVPAVPWRG